LWSFVYHQHVYAEPTKQVGDRETGGSGTHDQY
jgi:hypothetical protein